MNRDELVERMAEALGKLLNNAPRTVPPYVLEECASVALAIIEPAVREDIARELDCACDCRDAVLAATTKTDRWRACGRDPCSALDARDIRAGAKP